MPVAHADVADDDGVFIQSKAGLVGQNEVFHADRRKDRIIRRCEIVFLRAVVAELFSVFLLLPAGRKIVLLCDLISENDLRSFHSALPFLTSIKFYDKNTKGCN